MAFSTYQPLAVYIADGVQTDFAASDKFYDLSDVRCVLVIGGREYPQVRGVDYSVLVTGQDLLPPYRYEGFLRFVVPPANGAAVVPFIQPQANQDQPFEGRPVTPRQHERVHDRAVMSLAILQAFLDRGYRSPLNAAPGLRTIVTGREGYVPTWDELGNLVEGPTVGQIGQIVDIIPQINAVAAIAPQVVAVAAISTEVVGLYAVRANMAALVPITSEIVILSLLAPEIDALGAIAPEINTVGDNIASVVMVAANIASVNTVAANIAAVNTAATNMAAIIAAPAAASAAAASAAAAANSAASVGFPAGYLQGLFISNSPIDAVNDIVVAAGSGRDSTNAVNVVLATALTKRLDANCAVGDNQGGLDTGSIADATYHLWLIRRADTGVVDALLSLSATAPTMPANYTHRVYVAPFVRAGNIVSFIQTGRNHFIFGSPLASANLALTTAAASHTLARVPSGIRLKVDFFASVFSASANLHAYLSSLDSTDFLPAPATFSSLVTPGSAAYASGQFSLMVGPANTNIRVRASAAISNFSTLPIGWELMR